MVKKEMDPMPIKYLVIGMILILIPFGLYLFFWSMPASQLESKLAEKIDFEVEVVNRVTLSGSGLAFVAMDANENGLVQGYAKIPLLNRYMPTDILYFTDKGKKINFSLKVWAGYATLTWNQGKAMPTGSSDYDGWGVGGKVLFYLVALEIYMAALMLIRNDIIKTRREKAANPVKNY